jgi:hypothetical protein
MLSESRAFLLFQRMQQFRVETGAGRFEESHRGSVAISIRQTTGSPGVLSGPAREEIHGILFFPTHSRMKTRRRDFLFRHSDRLRLLTNSFAGRYATNGVFTQIQRKLIHH